MHNKNLQTLLRTVADQQAQQEGGEGAELENLGEELASKLKGGIGIGQSDETVNNGCTVINSTCAN